MTRVDFYILEDSDAEAPVRVACRLADKAFRLGHRVFVHAPAAAERIDEALWTFRAGSFVPHARAGRLGDYPQSLPAPVLIGDGEEPPPQHWDLLINLDDEVPMFFSRYQRLAEVVGGDPGQREQGRLRYRFYRDRGYELHTHRI